MTVQFRAPRLARPVPVHEDPTPDHNQKEDVANEFDVEGVVPEPNAGLEANELSNSPAASIAGPAITTPTDDQIAESPIADSQSKDTSAGDDLSAGMAPVGSAVNDTLESARSDKGPKVSRPAAEATGPVESLEPVDAAPTGSRDLSPGDDSASESAKPAAPVVEPPPPLTRQLINLRSRVRSVLKGYYRKPLNSRDHDPWEVMHGMLAYGVHSRIRQGGPRGEPITAVGWLCYNKPCKGPDADVRDAAGRAAGQVRRRSAGTFGPVAGDAGPVPRVGRLSDSRRQEGVHDPRPDRSGKEDLLSEVGADVQAARVAVLSRPEREVGQRPGRRVGLPAADSRGAGPADSRRGLRRHAPAVGPEPDGEGPRPSRRAARRRIRPGGRVRQEIPAVRVPAAEPRRQLEHRMVPRPRRRIGYQSPHQDHRPHPGMALLLAERRGAARSTDDSGRDVSGQSHVLELRP